MRNALPLPNQMFEHYYQILGIGTDADEKTLKKAFRKLALKYHPDVNKAADAKERFQQLCEAYEVITRNIKHKSTVRTDQQHNEEQPDYTYEDVIREARQAAYHRAKMKYEKMKAEREMFEQGNIREILLFFKYAGRVMAFPLIIFLFVMPVILLFKEGFLPFLILLFMWIIGGVLLMQMLNNRKTWFRQGKFKWKLRDFRKLFDFSPITSNPTADCYYCRGKKADGKSHNITFHKIRDVKIQNQGVYQHYVKYNSKFKDVVVPRSAKARKVHAAHNFITIITLVLSMVFVPYPDMIWRFCFGLFSGILLSCLLMLLTGTRSKVSYLLNYFLLIKISLWMLIIISQTTLYPGFILKSTDFTGFFVVVLFFFGDMILDLILKLFPFYHKIYLPLLPQGPVIDGLYRQGYQSYLDIPVWSTIYPLYTWFF